MRLVKFRQRSHSHQAVPLAPEHREHRKYRQKAGTLESSPAAHAGTHPDGGIGEPKLDRLIRKIPCRQPVQSQGGRGSTCRARMEQPFAIANGEIRRLRAGTARRSGRWREADDDDGPGGSQRSHDVHLLGPSARIHVELSVARLSCRPEAPRACPTPDSGRKTCRLQYKRPSWIGAFLSH